MLDPLAIPGVSAQQVEQGHLENHVGNDRRLFRRAANEPVLAQLRSRHQPAGNLAQGLQPLELEGQGRRHFGAARFVGDFVPRQQQTRLQVGQPGRHHQIVGGQLKLQCPGPADECQILVCQLQDRDLRDIDFLVPGEGEQQVQRTFETLQIEEKPVVGVRRAIILHLEIVVHGRAVYHKRMTLAPVTASKCRTRPSTRGRTTASKGSMAASSQPDTSGNRKKTPRMTANP